MLRGTVAEFMRVGITDRTGRFSVSALSNAPYRIVVELEHGQDFETTLNETGLRDLEATVELPVVHRIEGNVIEKNSGQPVRTFDTVLSREKILPTLLPSSDARGMSLFRIGDSFVSHDGSFQLSLYSEDLDGWALTICAPGFVPQVFEDVMAQARELQRGMPITMPPIELRRAGSLSGVVLDSETALPVENAEIMLEGSQQEGWIQYRGRGMSRADGSFECEDVPPGNVTVVVMHEGYDKPTRVPVGVMEGEETRDVISLVARGRHDGIRR